jgi:hypothetical protein
MESNRPRFPEPNRESPSVEHLETRLRRLPEPNPPDDLEAKLMAAIPPPIAVSKPARRKTSRWLAGTAISAILAATILMCIWVPLRIADIARQQRSSNQNGNTQTLPPLLTANNMKEIDPCNILPPLPDWH